MRTAVLCCALAMIALMGSSWVTVTSLVEPPAEEVVNRLSALCASCSASLRNTRFGSPQSRACSQHTIPDYSYRYRCHRGPGQPFGDLPSGG